MAEYQPIKTTSMATSTAESTESRVLSDDELIEVEDFASFKCYTPKEMESLFVTFSQSKQFYGLDADVDAHFYAPTSCYNMKPDDIVGICPMRKTVPFVSKRIAECESEANPEITEDIFEEGECVAKKAIFKIPNLPADLASEFYFQFCYMNAKNDVIGMSTPFRFQRDISSLQGNIASNQTSHQLDNMTENYDSMVMEKRDDDDFIVVRSQESFLKERVEHLTKSNTLLEYLIRSLEKDLSNKTVELQKISNKLDDEKSNVSKIEEEKNQALADFEDISRKHLEMQKSMAELKQLIQKERDVNDQLQSEVEFSKKKIFQLEDTFQNIQVEEVDLKNILKDKEEEISVHKDMVANLKHIHEELNKKLLAAEDKVVNLQSSLAVALNDRRALLQEKDKFHNYDHLVGENDIFKVRLAELELTKEKQANEIKTLEDELRNSVANFNNLDAKFQAERNANATNEQKVALSLDKTKFELIEMHARLEQSRVEYANLYRKYRTLQKVDRSKQQEKAAPSVASRSNSVASIASISGIRSSNVTPQERAKDNKMDDIDLKLQQLEKEEDVPKQIVNLVKSAANLSLESSPKESLLIDIENNDAVSTTSEVQLEANTSAKTLASPVIQQQPAPNEKTVVPIPCIMCDKVIQCMQHEDGSGQMHEMVNHLETVHKQKMCPVCSTLFDTRLPIFSTYFANHIQNHFNNIKYPSLNSN